MVDAAQNRKWVWVIGPPSLLFTSIQTAKRHENFRTLIYEEWKKPGIQAQVDNSGRSGSGGMKVGEKQMCNLMVLFAAIMSSQSCTSCYAKHINLVGSGLIELMGPEAIKASEMLVAPLISEYFLKSLKF